MLENSPSLAPSRQMKQLLHPRCLAVVAALLCSNCSQQNDSQAGSIQAQEATQALKSFLDPAVHESVSEGGSTENRWEAPHVTKELFVMTEMELARMRAFADGTKYDGTDIPPIRLPIPRSFWLPIASEGSYTYDVETTVPHDDQILITIRFHCHIGAKVYSDQTATYHMVQEGGGWKLSDVTTPDGQSLQKFLMRRNLLDYSDK